MRGDRLSLVPSTCASPLWLAILPLASCRGTIHHSKPSLTNKPQSPRSPRPAISSPLSTSKSLAYGPTSPSPRSAAFPLRPPPSPAISTDQAPTSKKGRVQPKETAFYSDSSDSESPEPRSARFVSTTATARVQRFSTSHPTTLQLTISPSQTTLHQQFE